MSKRRRTSSIASRGQEEDSLDSIEASSSAGRKRSKKQDPTELVQQLYDTIRNFKKDDGTLVCDAFIRVPKRRQEPRYYEVVTNPIDLLKVQQKIKTDEYEDVEDLQADVELIANNAKAFYRKNSSEYKDACELLELFHASKTRLVDGKDEDDRGKAGGRAKPGRKSAVAPETRRQEVIEISEDTSESSTNPDEDFNVYEDLFTAIMTATDTDNRPLHTEFQLLPSKKKYPEYYKVIESPIDLKTIAIKIQNNEYTNLNDMEKDLLTMTKNACMFNEPGSQIYKNAKNLKKVITSKKIEVEHGKFQGGKSSERIRNKRTRASTSLSAVTAALTGDDSEIEMEPEEPMEEEGEVVDSDNPKWQLFESVKAVANPSGTLLSEPFWKLPSRRTYPDYYKEIKNPVSLTQIRRKLVNQLYGTVSEVAGDLTIMFENAKKYNLQNSKLYKDAVKLQKIMQAKVQELLDVDQVTNTKVTNKTRKDTDSEDSEVNRRKSGARSKTPGTPAPRGRPPKDSIPMKKRLHTISKYLLDYTKEDGRKPMLAFMEKPSKKLYPDYYEVISEPIDFLEIESKIKSEQYANEGDLVRDFKLMFSNCRQYNEENSPIYEDATLLEKVLMDKYGHTIATPEKRQYTRVAKPRRILTPLERNCRTLYDTIKDYREPKANRQLASIFMRLPSKLDYPDYYDIIKNPVDMEKISHKVKSKDYETLDELVADLNQMFDNACKYNEPDSQIYKDALVLQRVCLQTKLQLKEDDDTIPEVPAAIQDLLLSLFTSVYNHQDADERCYSDSMTDLPEHDEVDGKKVRALSLDLIKRRLDKGLYKRLDTFQEDFFACLERARQLSRSDSQAFEDSVELQSFFIKLRDEICRNGELLHSPALNFTLANLQTAVEVLRQSKILQESLEDESETRSSEDSIIKETPMTVGDSMTCNQQTFKVGDFVYLESKDKGVDPHILLIERLWTNGGQQMLYGNYYLRPAETYHLTTRKFLEKEVFKSDTHVAVPLEEVKERCCVMHFRQYFVMKPEGFDEKDVYVCESRYSTKSRSFKRIKIYPESTNIVLIPRETPMEPKRVVSIFKERVEKHKDELAELQEIERLVEKEKPNVVAFTHMNIDDGNTYYEQYNTICAGVVKTGDFVYVLADGGRQTIAQIDTIWETKDGKCYFRGPWFITSSEVPQIPNRIFYRQELFLSTLEDTNPIVSIVGKCSVLDYNEYISSRLTEISESDVYICTSLYDEINRLVQKLVGEGLKKFNHSNLVTEDEIYYFPKLINPLKVGNNSARSDHLKNHSTIMEVESSPMVTKLNDMDILMEDSIDGPPSVGSGELPATVPVAGSSVATPATSRKKNKNKIVTGYILYSREVRKSVVANNPDSNFGEISRIVGNEWRSLPASEKVAWEEKATKMNEENKAKLLEEAETCSSPAPGGNPLHPDHVYECCWDNCDFQFEELSDCFEHCIKDKEGGGGHVQTYFQGNPDSELQCLWRGCARLKNKKNSQPFPNVARLVRHVRDLHINKGNGRIVSIENRTKNFKASSKPQVVSRPTPTATPTPSSASNSFNTSGSFSTLTSAGKATVAPTVTAPPHKQHEPMFISVPPRPQRALHSEAYIKYIEGLHAENKYISHWEKTLTVAQESIPAPDPEKINNVATWLGSKVNQQDNVLNALWALRNQLLRDTLGLQKTL